MAATVIALLLALADSVTAQTPTLPPFINLVDCQDEQPLGTWQGDLDWSTQVGPSSQEITCPHPIQNYPVQVLENELGHAVLLPTGMHAGKVLLWNYVNVDPGCDAFATTRTWFFDPDSPQSLLLLEENAQESIFVSNIFCAGQSIRPDGTVLIAGGFQGDAIQLVDRPEQTYVFDPGVLDAPTNGIIPWEPGIWIRAGDMSDPRYYPNLMGLGRTPIAAKDAQGQITWSAPGSSHMVLGGFGDTPNNPTWNSWFETLPSDLALQPPAPSIEWSVPLVPEKDILQVPPPPAIKHYKRYTLGSSEPLAYGVDSWDWWVENYPRSFLLSNGDILLTAVNSPTPPANKAWIYRPPAPDVAPADWQLRKLAPVPDVPGADGRPWSCAAMYHTLLHKDRVLALGGRGDDRSVYEYDKTFAETWRSKADMLHARMMFNAVILPTGKLFLVGGQGTPPQDGSPHGFNYEPELYDPGLAPDDSGASAPAAHSPVVPGFDPSTNHTPRNYHSLAMLLEDGSVLVCGGANAVDSQGLPYDPPYPPSAFTGEIYKPPYFYQGQRPVIRRVANSAQLWSSTLAETPTTFTAVVRAYQQGIQRVVLLRPAALTHHFDSDQRYIELSFTTPQNPDWSGNVTLTIETPEDIYAPPGFYMLFVLDRCAAHGHMIPSNGEFIQLLAE